MSTHALEVAEKIRRMPKVEVHQHVDGSIPPETLWQLLVRHGLQPVDRFEDMRKRLELQPEEEGSLLAYLDKFHYPLWITQFYENIQEVAEAIVLQAVDHGVKTLELRYSPLIHTYAGLTVRQAIRCILSAFNRITQQHPDLRCGLIVIAMRQHGPHIAKILARQAIAEAQHLHERSGVIGFDLAGPERGNPPTLFKQAYEIAKLGGLGLTVHAGEDAPAEYIWQAIDDLGARRIGHGCSAIEDKELVRRLARDQILVECCPTSNYQTGAVAVGKPHPIRALLDAGVPVALCTDNTTVSRTNHTQEAVAALEWLGEDGFSDLQAIQRMAERHTFIT